MATASNDNWRVRGGDGASGFRSSTTSGQRPRGSGGGGSGRGGGRSGGRSGGGRSRTTSTRKTDEIAAKEATTTSTTTSAVPAPVPAPIAVPDHNKPTTPSRPKGPSRRASRNVVPAVVVESSTPIETPTSANRPPNRRKRSQQGHPRPPASATIPAKGAFPPPLKDLSTSRGARNLRPELPNPPMTAPLPRDNNMRTNIDAAVEHMRAVALGDNRPSTPGSHIDWAGDEDDESLPDLNDWGVSTPQRPAGTPDPAEEQLISPLLVEGLKPLPELVSAKPVAGTPKTTSLPGLHIPAGTDVVNTVIDRSPTRSRDPSPIKPRSTRSRNASPNPSPVRDSKPVSPSFLPPKPAFLPERPTAAAQRAEMPARSSKANATPMRSPVSPVRARSRSPGHSPASSPKDTMHKLESHAKEEMNKLKEVDNHLAPPDDNVSGLSASIHAPSKEPSFPAEPLRSAPGNLQPLAAQQHDYHHTTIPNSNSYPNHTIPQKNPFTHNRAHTVGRPFQSHQFPSSHPTPRGARGAGFSTPPSSRRGEPAHARTQSSPPAPHGSYHRSPLNHRPVITGDAISRLARTIGGMGVNGQSTAQV